MQKYDKSLFNFYLRRECIMKRVFVGILAVVMCLWAFSATALPEGAVARLGKGKISSYDRAIAFSPDGKILAVVFKAGNYENSQRIVLIR